MFTIIYIFVRLGFSSQIMHNNIKNEMILSVLDANWDFINEQISRTFKGEKIKVKDLGK